MRSVPAHWKLANGTPPPAGSWPSASVSAARNRATSNSGSTMPSAGSTFRISRAFGPPVSYQNAEPSGSQLGATRPPSIIRWKSR